jgi:hypothetical protein
MRKTTTLLALLNSLAFLLVSNIILSGCGSSPSTPTKNTSTNDIIPPSIPSLPLMWVPMQEAKNRKNWFSTTDGSVRSKQAILTTLIGSNQRVSYPFPLQTFNNLITAIQNDNNNQGGNGVRVYFAAYDPTTAVQLSFQMGALKKNQLVLLFAPSKGIKQPDVGTYYALSLQDYQMHSLTANDIRIMKNIWVQDYISQIDNRTDNTGLASVVPHTTDNAIPSTSPVVYSDTRSIYYDSASFLEFFITEVNYQNSLRITAGQTSQIDGIAINFASVSGKGIGNNPFCLPTDFFQNRLIVMYQYLSSGNEYYIDTVAGFAKRTPQGCSALEERMHEKFSKVAASGDNGQLCPYNCNN